MYAIVLTGGKQYCVKESSTFIVEKLPLETGTSVVLDKVLLVGGEELKVGKPYLDGCKVECEVVAQGRGPRVRVFKRFRRNDSRCLKGHRQYYTTLRVKSITA